MKVTVFWNMTPCSLIMCTEISDEFAASIVTIDESFPDGVAYIVSIKVTHFYGASFGNLKVNFVNSAPATQVPIFNTAIAPEPVPVAARSKA
jgi:hypothetical protein